MKVSELKLMLKEDLYDSAQVKYGDSTEEYFGFRSRGSNGIFHSELKKKKFPRNFTDLLKEYIASGPSDQANQTVRLYDFAFDDNQNGRKYKISFEVNENNELSYRVIDDATNEELGDDAEIAVDLFHTKLAVFTKYEALLKKSKSKHGENINIVTSLAKRYKDTSITVDRIGPVDRQFKWSHDQGSYYEIRRLTEQFPDVINTPIEEEKGSMSVGGDKDRRGLLRLAMVNMDYNLCRILEEKGAVLKGEYGSVEYNNAIKRDFDLMINKFLDELFVTGKEINQEESQNIENMASFFAEKGLEPKDIDASFRGIRSKLRSNHNDYRARRNIGNFNQLESSVKQAVRRIYPPTQQALGDQRNMKVEEVIQFLRRPALSSSHAQPREGFLENMSWLVGNRGFKIKIPLAPDELGAQNENLELEFVRDGRNGLRYRAKIEGRDGAREVSVHDKNDWKISLQDILKVKEDAILQELLNFAKENSILMQDGKLHALGTITSYDNGYRRAVSALPEFFLMAKRAISLDPNIVDKFSEELKVNLLKLSILFNGRDLLNILVEKGLKLSLNGIEAENRGIAEDVESIIGMLEVKLLHGYHLGDVDFIVDGLSKAGLTYEEIGKSVFYKGKNLQSNVHFESLSGRGDARLKEQAEMKLKRFQEIERYFNKSLSRYEQQAQDTGQEMRIQQVIEYISTLPESERGQDSKKFIELIRESVRESAEGKFKITFPLAKNKYGNRDERLTLEFFINSGNRLTYTASHRDRFIDHSPIRPVAVDELLTVDKSIIFEKLNKKLVPNARSQQAVPSSRQQAVSSSRRQAASGHELSPLEQEYNGLDISEEDQLKRAMEASMPDANHSSRLVALNKLAQKVLRLINRKTPQVDESVPKFKKILTQYLQNSGDHSSYNISLPLSCDDYPSKSPYKINISFGLDQKGEITVVGTPDIIRVNDGNEYSMEAVNPNELELDWSSAEEEIKRDILPKLETEVLSQQDKKVQTERAQSSSSRRKLPRLPSQESGRDRIDSRRAETGRSFTGQGPARPSTFFAERPARPSTFSAERPARPSDGRPVRSSLRGYSSSQRRTGRPPSAKTATSPNEALRLQSEERGPEFKW